MVKYFCDRCGYSTNRRSVFKQHLKRKNPCTIDLHNVTIASIVERYNFKELKYLCKNKKSENFGSEGHPKVIRKSSFSEPYGFSDGHPKVIRKSSESHPFFPKNGIHKCPLCKKSFSSKQSRWRHQKNNCKFRHEIAEFQLEKTKKLNDEITKLEQKIININQNTYIENQHNNIIINNYGSENIEYITPGVIKNFIQQGPYASIPKLLKLTHFDKDHPENHNLAITNVKSKYAHVRKNDIWQIKLLNEILEDLIVNKFNIIDEYYKGELKDGLPNYKVNIYENYKEEITKNPEIREDIKEKLYETIINFSKILGIKSKTAK